MWREGESLTVYKGIHLPEIGDQGVLVSELSHGLRVIVIQDISRYRFMLCENRTVQVHEPFVKAVEKAMAADQEFQQQREVYHRLLGG
jgi:hypothetical protein